MKIGIGDRMKQNYEEIWKIKLPMRMPVILRIDGKNFHSFTRRMNKPFDATFIARMGRLTAYLCKEIQTSQFAYVQSDEISILLHPYKKLTSQAWFCNEIQKIVSITSGLASSWFSLSYKKEAIFDTRCFVLPEAEVVNYFIWRQQDATRNSIQMLARSLYSHKQVYKKNVNVLQDMIMEKKKNWNDLSTFKKQGFCIVKKDDKWKPDLDIPIFTKDRNYIEKYLRVEEI